MTKRMEKMKLQADLKKLQGYRVSQEAFKVNLENKASELKDDVETTGKHDRPMHWMLWGTGDVWIWIFSLHEDVCAYLLNSGYVLSQTVVYGTFVFKNIERYIFLGLFLVPVSMYCIATTRRGR